jgi:hypothetical protein
VPLPLTHAGSGTNGYVGGTVSAGLGLDHNESSIANDGSSQANNLTDGSAGVAYNRTGQPYQLCNDNADNDGDTLTDLLDPGCNPTGLPVHPGYPTCPTDGCAGIDSDGDGWTDEAEVFIGTDPFGRCEAGASPKQSTDWPADLDSTAGALDSLDKITVQDITSFLVPDRVDTSPGDPNYNPRFDLVPGLTPPFTTWIATNDLTALLAGSSGYPPMFNGQKANGGPTCTAHPLYGD